MPHRLAVLLQPVDAFFLPGAGPDLGQHAADQQEVEIRVAVQTWAGEKDRECVRDVGRAAPNGFFLGVADNGGTFGPASVA